MKKWNVHVATGLGLSLLLFACGQAPPAQSGGDPYAGPDHPWSYAAPDGKVGQLSLTPGLNTLYYEPMLTATNGWGPVEVNHSNGEWHAGDGKTITLNGVTFQKGFGVHAPSELRYSLKGTDGAQCNRFTVDVGVDDEVGSRGSVVFQVFLDGQKAYDSGTMTGASATKTLNVDITGKQELRMIVTDAGDGKSYDHADWANPRIYCAAGQQMGPSGGVDGSFKQIKPDFTVADSAVQADGKIVVFGTGDALVINGAPEFVIARYNADGSLDTSFGTNGKTRLIGGSDNTAYRVLVQADGKILAAGRSRFPMDVDDTLVNVALLRLLPNGQPDPSFGTNGVAFAGTALRKFSDFAVQSNGKIVVVEGSTTFGIVRFNADGSLDTSFGSGGRVTTPTPFQGTAQAVTVQSDGKIVAGGNKLDGPPNTLEGEYGSHLFVRYTPNGGLDSSFGNGGQALTNPGRFLGRVDALALQADGRLLYGGSQNFTPYCKVSRLNANGSDDTSYHFDSLRTALDTNSSKVVLALQQDAKVVVAGCNSSPFDSNASTPLVFRLKTDGTFDTTFGKDGLVTVADNRDVGLQPGGKILVGLNPITRLFP